MAEKDGCKLAACLQRTLADTDCVGSFTQDRAHASYVRVHREKDGPGHLVRPAYIAAICAGRRVKPVIIKLRK